MIPIPMKHRFELYQHFELNLINQLSIILYNKLKVSKEKVPTKALKSPTPEESDKSDSRESSPEKSMEVEEPSTLESDKPAERSIEEKKSPTEAPEPSKKDSKKAPSSKPIKKKPSLDKHDVEITELGSKEVETIEKPREKPEEKESIFVSGIKLKKSSIVKREIEKPKLETVDLVSHADEGLPVSEEVSLLPTKMNECYLSRHLKFSLNSIHFSYLCFV